MTHNRRPLVAVVLLAMVAVYAVTLLQGRAYRQQVTSLRRTLYAECVSREPYDAKSQQTRAAFRDYYQHYIVAETSNRFIDAKLRAQRIADARLLITSLDATLASSPVARCVSIRP